MRRGVDGFIRFPGTLQPISLTMEAAFLEIAGFVGVTGAAFALSSVLTITPFNYSYSRAQNQAIFCAIPAAVYLAYRIYFGVCFYLSSFTPKKFRYLGEHESFQSCLWSHLSFFSVCVLLLLRFSRVVLKHPPCKWWNQRVSLYSYGSANSTSAV